MRRPGNELQELQRDGVRKLRSRGQTDALGPLDVFLSENPAHGAANGLAFMTLGVSLCVVALYIERKRLNVSGS